MCSWTEIRKSIVALAMIGLLIPPSFVAAQPPSHESRTASVAVETARDVALDDNGSLAGVVVDSSGTPQDGVLVYILKDGSVYHTTSTSESGEFSLNLTQGGVYNLIVGNRTLSLRIWPATAAPPSASRPLLVAVDEVYRGQIHPAACGLGSPWVIAGLVTAAVVIPVALHNNRSDRESSSQ